MTRGSHDLANATLSLNTGSPRPRLFNEHGFRFVGFSLLLTLFLLFFLDEVVGEVFAVHIVTGKLSSSAEKHVRVVAAARVTRESRHEC